MSETKSSAQQFEACSLEKLEKYKERRRGKHYVLHCCISKQTFLLQVFPSAGFVCHAHNNFCYLLATSLTIHCIIKTCLAIKPL